MDFETMLPLLMFVALAVLLFTGMPVAFILGGVAVIFGVGTAFYDDWLFRIGDLYAIVTRIWGGQAASPLLTAIPLFIFMGTMLERSGAANDLLRCLSLMLRRVPGGVALSVTLMGTILAATTGIIGASVVMMSMMSLPMMMKLNYNKGLASGTVAASGTLGILIPPSIMLVIMADLLAKSVGNLFVAALFPGLLLSGLYLAYILIACTLNPKLAPPSTDDTDMTDAEMWLLILRAFVPPVLLVAGVLGSILAGVATPTEAAGIGAAGAILLASISPIKLLILVIVVSIAYVLDSWLHLVPLGHVVVAALVAAIVLGFIEKRLNFGMLRDVVERTSKVNGMLFMLFISATAFAYVFRSLGGDDVVIDFVRDNGFGPWEVLFFILLLVFVLGFFFDWLEITLIVLPVFAPIITQLDFGDHVMKQEVVYWFAILIAVNLQTSFLTPPFGFALFYMKGAAPPELKLQDIYRGIIPFVILQLIGLSMVIMFPEIALWLPRVLLD